MCLRVSTPRKLGEVLGRGTRWAPRSESLTTERLSRFGNRQINLRMSVEAPTGLMSSRVTSEAVACASLVDSGELKMVNSVRERACNDVTGPMSLRYFLMSVEGGRSNSTRRIYSVSPHRRRVAKDLY